MRAYYLEEVQHDYQKSLEDVGRCIMLGFGKSRESARNQYLFELRADLLIGYLDKPSEGLSDALMASRIKPGSRRARLSVSLYYFKTGKYHMADLLSQELLQTNPEDPPVLCARAATLIQLGRLAESAKTANRALHFLPNDNWGYAYWIRGNGLFAKGDHAAAIKDYDKAFSLYDDIRMLGSKAYLLASCPDPRFRDGKTAQELAKKCSHATGGKKPYHLMLQAMAEAECGDFEAATRLAQLSLEKADTDFPFKKQYEERLKLFMEKKPYRFSPESRPYDFLDY